MKKRFYVNPLFYGAVLGGMSAFIGSIFFVVLGFMFFGGFHQIGLADLSIGLRLIFMFTALPGVVGGVFLGYLFSRHKFSQKTGVLYGAATGAFAALTAIYIFFAALGGSMVDTYVFGFAILAILIAAIMAGTTSFILLKTTLTRVEMPAETSDTL